MRSLGFNVVRLGIEWQALEPGSGGPNQPKICAPGAPTDPHEFNAANLLAVPRPRGRDPEAAQPLRIYTLLDMHQTSTTAASAAKGRPIRRCAPTAMPIVPKAGRRSNYYSNLDAQHGVLHFWTNDVVGNLQGQFDLVWATVAKYFSNDPWVLGYDPYNEPFS